MFISLCRALCKPYCPKKTSKLRFRNCPIRSNPPFQMPINLQNHVFAGNPLKSKNSTTREKSSSSSTIQSLRKMISGEADEEYLSNLKVLPFRKGRPLTWSSSTGEDSTPVWKLGFVNWVDLKGVLGVSEEKFSEDLFVYLGSDHELSVSYWAMDASSGEFGVELGNGLHCFVELRTLMVATDWMDEHAMGELALAGQAKALLEWHNTVRFCGFCGESTMPIDAGRRKQCSNELCKKRIYPRVDPVVIMLVIDKANDRALLSRQSRYVPRMWSCLAGFLEPGESLEEAVRRETWEETGVEVGEVIYHSSQPWPVGPNSMPCQLMVGFIAYAKTFEIHVDKNELEDAQWYSREDVKKSLILAEYDKAQKKAAIKVEQMCKGSVEKDLNISNVESGDLAPIFIPGPYAIAHHLISSWVNQDMHPTKLFSEQNVSNPCQSKLLHDGIIRRQLVTLRMEELLEKQKF